MCMDLKNPWNDNKPVKISRDGQVWSRVNLYSCGECCRCSGQVSWLDTERRGGK